MIKLCKVLFLCSILSISSHSSWASHIFGGNLYLTQIDKASGKFKLTMNVFVDGNTLVPVELSNLQTQSRLLRIFSKSGNVKMMDVALPFEKLFDLVYDNESCSKLKNLKTKEFRYSQEIILDPNTFSDNGGYYIAWTRCCRNGDIDNIVNPADTGLTLYLEFPALRQNGENIAYSSPTFPVPNGDYICANKAFKLDLGADNPEPKDELRYSIVTPNGSLNDLNNYDRIVQAGPYPKVGWLAGYSSAVSIKGAKPLSVDSKTGVISVTASIIGLYVFTIQCDQYRNGVKIGSIRQDYQLPVVDCSGTTPPAGKITSNGNPITETAICPGEIVNLEVSAAGGNFNFQWQKDGDNIIGANTLSYQATQLGDYTVVKSFKTVCANDTTSQVVRVKQVVLVKVKSPTAILCEGDSVQIEAIPQRNTVAFNWNTGGASLGNKGTFYAKKAGKYYVLGSITSPNCESKDSVEVTKKASPMLTIDSRILIMPLGESRTLNVRSDNVGTVFKWSPPKWIDNVSVNNPKVTSEANIVYRVLASTPNL